MAGIRQGVSSYQQFLVQFCNECDGFEPNRLDSHSRGGKTVYNLLVLSDSAAISMAEKDGVGE
jgi:hypothetical protein